ncbi:MAG: cell envelope integrity EipB family protein [Methyloceanibacter sp.]|uniref:cell envelope integrity EipB family protein n=1 Tax=Methyloceanibacter sp. TaxID=1965321 RepID=UPI003D6D5A6D
MRRRLALVATLGFACALPGHALALAAKEPSKLMPHRAVYEMTLQQARSASGITGIDGRMVFEFTGSPCDGYSLNMRMVTQMTDSQGQINMTDLRSSTWEQGDGTKFRFQSAQYLNDKLGDVTMGRAVRAAPNAAVEVKLSQPSRAELNLSGPVFFPTQHSIALIEKALSGQSLFQARIYDGSEKGRKVYETTAFIGSEVKPGADDGKLEAPAKDKKLGELPSWPVSIGYFEPKEGDLTPSYQIDFRLYENGVSRELLIDYGDFSIHGTLTSLEYLQVKACK